MKVVQRIPVRIALDANQDQADRLRPGMSVEPKITFARRAELTYLSTWGHLGRLLHARVFSKDAELASGRHRRTHSGS